MSIRERVGVRTLRHALFHSNRELLSGQPSDGYHIPRVLQRVQRPARDIQEVPRLRLSFESAYNVSQIRLPRQVDVETVHRGGPGGLDLHTVRSSTRTQECWQYFGAQSGSTTLKR